MAVELELRMEMVRIAALEAIEDAVHLRTLARESVYVSQRQVQEHMEQRFLVREAVARSAEARRRCGV